MTTVRKVSIVPANKENQDFLKKIFFESRFDLIAIPDLELQSFIMQQQYQIEESQLSCCFPNFEKNLIKMDEEFVGRIYLNRNTYEYRILELGFLESYRRKGLGKAVLTLVKERALKENKAVTLQVAWFNQGAKCFYEKMGFKTLSTQAVFCEMVWEG